MLQTTPSVSSIQRRRILHRRQQSLETPILAPPLPQTPRRPNISRMRTGRNHSIDLGIMAGTSTSMPPQPSSSFESDRLTTGPSLPRIQEPANQLTTIPEQHLNKQESQEHSLAQPGIRPLVASNPPLTFQNHLQQQLNGVVATTAPSMTPEQVAAMQSLQSHLMWYQQKFGNVGGSVQQQPTDSNSFMTSGETNISGLGAELPGLTASASGRVAQSDSQTVPNTPQARRWASPPPSHQKHSRSQSYQVDTAPMPSIQDTSSASNIVQGISESDLLEREYAASVYSSSITDASSPQHQRGTPLPTLFEGSTLVGGADQHNLLLRSIADAEEPDFNDPHFVVGGLTPCPEQAALDAAGIDATYIDTGISEDILNSWLVPPQDKGDPFVCKFQGCGAAINRKENARSHVQNHLDDRRFQCNPCGKRFSRMHDTKRHFLTHTQERPAVCPCGKTFARADALTRHRQRDMCAGVLPGFEKTDEDRPKRGRPKKERTTDDADGSNKLARRNTNGKKSNRPDMETRTRKAHLARTMDQISAANGYHNAATSPSESSDRSMPDTPPHDHDAMDATDFLNLDGAQDQFNSATSTWLDTPPTSPPSSSPMKHSQSHTYIDLSADGVGVVSPAQLSNHSSPHATTVAGLPSLRNSPAPVTDATQAILSAYSSPAAFNAATGFQGESSPFESGDVDVFDFNVMDTHPNVAQDPFSPAGGSDSGTSSYHSDFDALCADVGPAASAPQGKTTLAAMLQRSNAAARTAGFAVAEEHDDLFGLNQQGEPYGSFVDMLDAWISAN